MLGEWRDKGSKLVWREKVKDLLSGFFFAWKGVGVSLS